MSSMCGTSSNGVPTSGGSGLSCRWVTPTTSPIAPCRSSRVVARQGGAQRPLWFTATRTPAASAFASRSGSRARSSAERVSGFWASTCLPASMAASSQASRPSGPVARSTYRTSGSASSSSALRVDAADEGEPLADGRGRGGRPAPDAGDADAVLLVRRQVGRLGDRAAARGSPRPSGPPGSDRGPVSRASLRRGITGPPGTAARPAGCRGRRGRAARRPRPRRRPRRRR